MTTVRTIYWIFAGAIELSYCTIALRKAREQECAGVAALEVYSVDLVA